MLGEFEPGMMEFEMTTQSACDLDEDVKRKLRPRVACHGVSKEAEARRLLAEAADRKPVKRRPHADDLKQFGRMPDIPFDQKVDHR
ncbi:MAG: hypothetical protein VYD64_02645 [Pseudomonadota bacterium]|nr:hypothetical protein [Pseudomonadota bacterium]